MCEGAKTEPLYFRALRKKLRLHTVEVEVEGEDCGSSPISVVNYAISLRDARRENAPHSPRLVPYDAVWCVMDVEAPTPHASLAAAIDKAKANQLNIALTNPMFEYWYLLHFERTSALMQSNRHLLGKLKNHYGRYKKNDPDFFEVVYPLTSTAIANSEAVLREKHYGEDLRDCNPSTHVHRVVGHLQQIARRSECGATSLRRS
ncbi:MAG: RloB domain-containing protein [Sedimentisphaerales bacterium]|nr:RloB domain-containing protein [Sedimentisphaerales bacterium]